MPNLVERIKLTNFLSFGPEGEEIELGPLNVLIGPNASGKSNFLEAFALLQSAPRDLVRGVREVGGIRDLMWKGNQEGQTTLDVDVEYRGHTLETEEGEPAGWVAVSPELNLQYTLELTAEGSHPALASERIAFRPNRFLPEGKMLYEYQAQGLARLVPYGRGRSADEEPSWVSVNTQQSVLSQRKELGAHDPITYLGAALGLVRLYRDWSFGRGTPARQPQPADLPADFLDEDTANLAAVLSWLRNSAATRAQLVEHVRRFHEAFEDFESRPIGGFAQLFVRESGLSEDMPANRLSDGTLRYLSLLAVLLHPEPPPLICIEEPELGLHPDIIHVLAELLRDASERTQLIITTHSDLLVSAFTDQPEAVVVCEKDDRGTHMQRLDSADLKTWLEKYSLGELWLKGMIGGTRW